MRRRTPVLLLALGACAREEPPPPPPPPAPHAILSAHDAWARPADSGATSAVYLTLMNTSKVPDTIVAVSSPAAEETGMHVSMQQGRMMTMAALRALPLPAEDSVRFVPLGAHLMLLRATRTLVAGDTVVVTLTFRSGQALEVRAGVRAP